MVEELRNIHRHVFPNGLTVISEEMQHIRSISIGIWIKTGSRDEEPESNGLSHFIEHMVFKGTKNRSAEAIARQVDSIGGNLTRSRPRSASVSTSRFSTSICPLRWTCFRTSC